MALVVVVPVIILLYFIFVLGTATISRQLSAGVTAWLKDAGRVAGFVLGPTVTLTLKLTRWITNQVGEVFSDAERLAVAWFSGLYQWAALAIGQALSWPVYLFKLQWWIVNHAIPNAIRAALRGVHGSVDYVTKVLPKVERTIVKFPKLTKAQILAAVLGVLPGYLVVNGKIRALIRHLVHAAVGALPAPWAFPHFRRTWKEMLDWRNATAKRLRRLELLLGASGLALAVAKMTATKFECWRPNGNIWRTLRHICGLPTWLIDFLLLGTVEAFIASDLCAFSNLLVKQAQLMQPVLLEFVDVENALVKCSGVKDLYPLELPALSLPPMPPYPALAV
jgi:hypothetical protein